jgi:hypothetical protein
MQLYRYFVSQSSEFCCHNPLCCFSTTVYCCKCIRRYRLSPEAFGYTLVLLALTAWSRSLLEKLVVTQLFKKFLTIYGTRKFITVVTRALHQSLSRATWTQSTRPQRISLRSVLIQSPHLHLDLPNDILPSGYILIPI